MSFAIRAVLTLLIAVLIAFGIMLMLDQGKYCPEDQVSVLSADRWVCVKKGDRT